MWLPVVFLCSLCMSFQLSLPLHSVVTVLFYNQWPICVNQRNWRNYFWINLVAIIASSNHLSAYFIIRRGGTICLCNCIPEHKKMLPYVLCVNVNKLLFILVYHTIFPWHWPSLPQAGYCSPQTPCRCTDTGPPSNILLGLGKLWLKPFYPYSGSL